MGAGAAALGLHQAAAGVAAPVDLEAAAVPRREAVQVGPLHLAFREAAARRQSLPAVGSGAPHPPKQPALGLPAVRPTSAPPYL